MKIPSKLKVGGHLYDVEFQTLQRGTAESTVDKLSLKLIMDENMPVSIKEEGFIHEMLHACFYEMGISNANKSFKITEEEIVSRLSPILYQVLKENFFNDKNKSKK